MKRILSVIMIAVLSIMFLAACGMKVSKLSDSEPAKPEEPVSEQSAPNEERPEEVTEGSEIAPSSLEKPVDSTPAAEVKENEPEQADAQEEKVPEKKKLLGIISDKDQLVENTGYNAFCRVNGVSKNDFEDYKTYYAYSLKELKEGVSSLAASGCSTIIIGNSSFIVPEDVLSSLRNDYPEITFLDSDYSILILTKIDRELYMGYSSYIGILRNDIFLSLESFSGLNDRFNNTKQIKRLYNTFGANGSFRGGYAISNENIPVPCLEENDKVVCYSSSNVPTIELYPAVFTGFSPRFYLADVSGGSDYYFIYDNKVDVPNHIIKQIREDTPIEVTDENGNKIEDYHNVTENTVCTISWYEGTQYNEEKVIANCRVYSISEEAAFEIEGVLTKEGYAEYDFSSVPSGLYRVDHNGGLLQIP